MTDRRADLDPLLLAITTIALGLARAAAIHSDQLTAEESLRAEVGRTKRALADREALERVLRVRTRSLERSAKQLKLTAIARCSREGPAWARSRFA